MEMINWSLNATDTIFSRRSLGSGEPACPDGTMPAGYAMDGWEKWRVVCLVPLSIEDIEDVYLFGFMIVGFLLIGLGIALVYREIERVESVVNSPRKLPNMIDGMGRAVGAQTVTVSRSLEFIMEQLTALNSKFERLEDRSKNGALNQRDF